MDGRFIIANDDNSLRLNLNPNEQVAVELRKRLLVTLRSNQDAVQKRMINWVPGPKTLVKSLIYCLEQAFLCPMNQPFFEKSQRYRSQVHGRRVNDVWLNSHPQLWVFTDFTVQSLPDQDIPPGYEGIAMLTNIEPHREASLIQFFIKLEEPIDQLPYIFGMKVDSTDRITGALESYGAVEHAILQRYGPEIERMQRQLIQASASLRGWRLIGYQ